MTEEIDQYLKAGKIAADVRERSRKLINPGAKLVDIAETIEGWIREAGAGFGFPCNISVNERAAHFTPSLDDEEVLGEKDVVKVDLGTHIDGYVGDTAYTVDLSGENGKLVEASEEALQNALSVIKEGTMTDMVGAEIEKTITKHGFKPVVNLGGHQLSQYELHAGLQIPNTKTRGGYVLEEGMAVAVEPFASTGTGTVKEERRVEIFSYEKDILTRNMDARKILQEVKEEYQTLPFAERWLSKKHDKFKLSIALRELVSREGLHSYPILRDTPGSYVSQAEVTVIVEKDGCKITT